MENHWASDWKSEGVGVIGWGWLQDEPTKEAELAVSLCEEFDLDGYIANGEDPIEGPTNYWKSYAFTERFRELAPHAPLALSYIGDGYPHRDLPFNQWVAVGAALMPQCYWSNSATSIYPSLAAASRARLPRDLIVPTLGTSSFTYPYPFYGQELKDEEISGFNVWLLESTNDDVLRSLFA